MSTTVAVSTITREPAEESTVPRTAKYGRMHASVLLGDLFVGRSGGESSETMCGLSKVDGRNLISALADVLGVEVVVVEPVQPTCTVCGAATTGARCEKCVPVVVAR